MKFDSKLEYGFVKRTFMYGGAGICGVAIDSASFMALAGYSFWLPISVVNILTYTLGTFTSYSINKRFSFKSRTHTLSLTRFYLTSIAGMMISTLLVLYLVNTKTDLLIAKIAATIVAVFCQYAINTKFSMVRKT